MREILFRGKRIDNGEWEYGDLIKIGSRYFITHKCSYQDGCLSFGKYFEIDSNTVGQYTGRYDKNGVMIFEGDIVKWIDNQTKGRNIKGVVTIYDISWCVKNIFNGDYENLSRGNDTLEVISNIYEDLELLEV